MLEARERYKTATAVSQVADETRQSDNRGKEESGENRDEELQLHWRSCRPTRLKSSLFYT